MERIYGDAIINKIDFINRCLRRVNKEYLDDPENIKDYTKQDSIVFSLQRAYELSIDIANYIVANIINNNLTDFENFIKQIKIYFYKINNINQ